MTRQPSRWRAGAWSVTGQATLAFGAAARGVLFVRLLDGPHLGELFLLLSAAAIAANLGQTGLAMAGLRRVTESDDPSVVSHELRSIVALAAATTVGASAITGLVLWWFRLSTWEIVPVVALMVGQLWMGLLSMLVRGLRRITLSIAHEQIVVPVVQVLVLGLFVIRQSAPSLGVLIASQAACLIPSLIALALPVLTAARVPPAPHGDSQAARLKETAAVALNSLVWRAYADVPLWVAGLVLGTTGAALYGVASRLAGLLMLPSLATIVVLSADVGALLGQRRYAVVEPQLRLAAGLATLASVAGLIPIAFFGPQMLRFLFGAPFAPAWTAAVVLGIGQVINAAAGSGGVTLMLMNEARRLVTISIGATAGLTLLSWPLARAFGLEGIAWAWCAAVTAQNVLMVVTVRRLTGMRIYARLRR